MRLLYIITIMVVYVFGATATVDFDRYAPILERRPFSSPVPEAPPAPPVATVEAPPDFVKHLRMVAITESPAGIRVGFVNVAERPPKTYFLYVGDGEDGFVLADADFDRERALVRKDGEQFWMTMGFGSSPDETEQASVSEDAPVRRRPPGVIRAGAPQPSGESDGDPSQLAASYAERRRQRIEEMRRRAQESRNLSEEEVEQRLREYQMRLIREGRTPLPIPITEEMDAQLVEEGILPPRD